MQKNNSNVWTWIVIIIAVAVILFFIFKNKPADQTAQDANTEQSANNATEPESVQDTSETSPVTSAGTAASISYANALVKYADRRIQLDPSCQARPNTVTYKDNTGIMIDNRSAKTRTVKVGTTFTMKPYSFKIVVLPDVYRKSSTLLVDCDGSQNVATILIQE